MPGSKLFKVVVNISGEVFTEFTIAKSEISARLNIARRLEKKLGKERYSLTFRLTDDSSSVFVEEVYINKFNQIVLP